MWPIIELYIGLIILALAVFYFAKIILTEKRQFSNKIIILFIFLISIIHLVIYLTTNGTLKTILILFVNTLFYKKVFNISLKKSIFLVFIYTIILMVVDLLNIFFGTLVLNITKSQFYTKVAGGNIANLISSILMMIFTNILKNPLRRLLNAKIENNTKIILFSILISICILMFFYITAREFRFSNNVILYLVAMIVMLLVLSSLIKQTIENNKITKKYDKLLEFMTTYENEIERQRILRHEVKNEFLTIRAKICDKEKNEKVIKYIDDILEEKIKVNQEKYAKFGYLPPNGIKGLCYFKVQEAEEKGIAVSLSITKKIKDSVIYDFDIKQQRNFGKILGVILDNAIEASKESEKKQMGMQAYVNTKKEFRMIISNSFDNKVDETKIGKEVFSTKGKNRGHGLLLVKSIIDKNDMFDIKTEIQDDIYTQTIIVKNTIKN